MLLAGFIPGIALLAISLIYIGYFLIHLIAAPNHLLLPMLFGLALALLWFAWLQLPLFLIRLLKRGRTRK